MAGGGYNFGNHLTFEWDVYDKEEDLAPNKYFQRTIINQTDQITDLHEGNDVRTKLAVDQKKSLVNELHKMISKNVTLNQLTKI